MFNRIPNIYWLCIIRSHQSYQSINQIGYVLKRTCLFAVSINLFYLKIGGFDKKNVNLDKVNLDKKLNKNFDKKTKINNYRD